MGRYAGTRPVRNICPRKLWATLKGLETRRNDVKQSALRELMERRLATATVFRIKGILCWVLTADNRQAVRWRAIHFVKAAQELIGQGSLLAHVGNTQETFKKHLHRILRRWESLPSNARRGDLNGLFQAAPEAEQEDTGMTRIS